MRPEKWKHTKITHFNIKQVLVSHIFFTQIGGECAVYLAYWSKVNNRVLISEDPKNLLVSSLEVIPRQHFPDMGPKHHQLEITRWIEVTQAK